MCSTPRKSVILKAPRSHPKQISGANNNKAKSRNAGDREAQLQRARALRQQQQYNSLSSNKSSSKESPTRSEPKAQNSLFTRLLEKFQQLLSLPHKTIN